MKYIIVLKEKGIITSHYLSEKQEFLRVPENILEIQGDAWLFESYGEARDFAEAKSLNFNGKKIEVFPATVNLFEDFVLDIRGIREDAPKKLFLM